MKPVLRLFTLLLLAGCAVPPRALPPVEVQPEAASGYQLKTGGLLARQAVVAAHPLAAEAGLQMLRAGGSALDAAIAAQMVLGLVEPQSSGIGGGAFLLHAEGSRVQAFDGRETAPGRARPEAFLDTQGRPMAFSEAVLSGQAVGVPGAVRMLEAAHRQHGQLPWARLLAPAIELADAGYPVSQRLHTLLQADPHLRLDPVARRFFYTPEGPAWPVGHVLRNPEYAQVLRRIARDGSRALHEGEVAQAMVERAARPPQPGALSLDDLRQYQPRERAALCVDHQAAGQAWRLCGFPPPSSGHIAVAQILGLLCHTQAQGSEREAGLPSADWLHRFSEASRLAMADRAQYVADPDFVPPPGGDWQSLVAPDYLRERSRLIGPRALQEVMPGRPGAQRSAFAPMPAQPEFGTSHISVIDAQGRAVALTSSIESAFGGRRMVSTDASRPGGFLLNNQLTDFSLTPADALGRPVANRLEPGKRPRSSMSPTLVMDAASGQPVMSLGSAGGAYIIAYTAKALWATLHWGLPAQEALALPNLGQLGTGLRLETGRFPAATLEALRSRGTEASFLPLTSGTQLLQRSPAGWTGAADPRREGQVLGD